MSTRGRQSISITRIGFLQAGMTFLTPLKMKYEAAGVTDESKSRAKPSKKQNTDIYQ
jgi:hypothetical protein